MLNKAILQGRLVADPELKYTQSNTAVLSTRIACDRDYQKDGSQSVDFINIVAWQKTAEFVSKYFHKGDMLLLEGRIQVRDYTDRDGNKRYATEVVADHVNFCSSKQDSAQGTQQRSYEPTVSYGGGEFVGLEDEDGEFLW